MSNEFKEFIVERMEGMSPEVVILDGLDDLEMEFDYKEQVVEVYNGKKFYNDAWEVSISRGDVALELTYTQGEGWHGEEPLLKNVLYSVLSDYRGYKDSTSFEDYCDIYGMEKWEEFEDMGDEDEDEEGDGRNKRSLAIYELVGKQADVIEQLFSGEELEFLSKVYQDY